MQELVTVVRCDVCVSEAGGDLTAVGNDGRTVGAVMNGVIYEIDVCDRHGKPLEDAEHFLMQYGRYKRKRATLAVAESVPVTGPAGYLGCLMCRYVASNRSVLGTHYTRVHDTKLTTAEHGRDFPCELCGATFASYVGLTQHSIRTHSE